MKTNYAQSPVLLTNNKYINSIYTTDNNFKNHNILNINTLLELTTENPLSEVDMSKQGIGSGAGYVEISNGTFNTYDVDSNGEFIK